ncbi:MAG: CarD family transcriptional regulator [Lachnospiraceae bacterium]|nr:CarD family transcriptional regulator [Lachnospiraceae bacterium]
MFEKGEYVVYGSKGVCQIEDISQIDIPGVDRNRLYYIMRPVHNSNGTVYLPIDSTKAVIRRVMSKEEACRLIDEIPQIEELSVPDEKRRELSYKEAMKTCSVRSWVSIIKALYFRKTERLAAGKKITALDERYMKAAEHELYGELSLVLGMPQEEVETYIHDHIEKKN